MRGQQDRPAGRFVDAPRLHADKPVLNKVDPADTVIAPQIVQGGKERRRRHRFAIQRNRIALFKPERDCRRLVGRLFRRHGPHEHVIGRRDVRIFEHFAL